MIMNEKERVESLLKMGDFSSSDYHEVRLIIRYYISELKMSIREEILEKIKIFLEEKMTDYYEWEWEDKLESIIKEELRNQTPITSIGSIYVTHEEIDIIRKLKNQTQRKLLFTLIMYARYNALKRGVETEWASAPNQQDIFKSANINHLTVLKQNLVVKELLDMELISQSKHMRKLNLKVNCLYNEGSIAFWVTSFEDMGNLIEDYINFNYNGYKKCEVCGKLYKPKAKDYSSKYCNPCKKEVIKEKDRARKSKKL